MKKKNILIIGGIAVVIGVTYAAYILFFQPNRNTQSVEAAFTINSKVLVKNCLEDMNKVHNDLLSDDGESEVFVVEGIVKSTEKDQDGKVIVFLDGGNEKPLVRCTFINSPNEASMEIGTSIKVKGVFRSCAEIDEDLDEDAIIDQCAIVE